MRWSRRFGLETKSHETRWDTRPSKKIDSNSSKFWLFVRYFSFQTETLTRHRLARQSHETRRDRDGLVLSRLFSRRDRLVTGPSFTQKNNYVPKKPFLKYIFPLLQYYDYMFENCKKSCGLCVEWEVQKKIKLCKSFQLYNFLYSFFYKNMIRLNVFA